MLENTVSIEMTATPIMSRVIIISFDCMLSSRTV